MNILNIIKGFVGTHKLASIITASVVGVGAIGGTTVGVIHAVNNNKDDDTKVEATTNVNTTDMTATALEGQEINPADLQDVTEEVQADGTSVIKDKNGTVIAKKDASGKTTLTKDGGVALASGSMQASGDLANNVNNAQAQTQSYVASMPANNNNASYTPSFTPSPAPSNNYVAPSTPTFSQPVSCSHNWVTVPEKSHVVHHDAVYTEADVPIYEMKWYCVCDACGQMYPLSDEGYRQMAIHCHNVHPGEVIYNHQHAENVQVGTEHRTNKVSDAWDETVVDSPAYTYCSKCGARQ